MAAFNGTDLMMKLVNDRRATDAIFPHEDSEDWDLSVALLDMQFKTTGAASIELPSADRRELARQYPGLFRRCQHALNIVARQNKLDSKPYLDDNAGEPLMVLSHDGPNPENLI